MLALHDWQQQLQRAILCGEASAALLHSVRRQGVIAQQRVGIYQDAYHLRLTEALASNYPALARQLGESQFSALARAYSAVHPSRHASIRWFGNELALFLRTQAPWSSTPLLHELAQFEWALRHTVDAADQPVLTIDALRALPVEHWPGLALQLHSATTMHFLCWNTPGVWSGLMEGREPPELEYCPQHWLVYRRQDLMAMWRSVSEREARWLQLTVNGCSFSDLCDGLAAEGTPAQEIPAQAAALLWPWADAGLLVDTTVKH